MVARAANDGISKGDCAAGCGMVRRARPVWLQSLGSQVITTYGCFGMARVLQSGGVVLAVMRLALRRANRLRRRALPLLLRLVQNLVVVAWQVVIYDVLA